MVLGTIVFEFNEDWTSADAFYFTIVTMTVSTSFLCVNIEWLLLRCVLLLCADGGLRGPGAAAALVQVSETAQCTRACSLSSCRRVFTIFFIYVCLITYAALIQNTSEMYLLTFGLPPSSDNDLRQSGENARILTNPVGDNDARSGNDVELSSGSGATFNPLDGSAQGLTAQQAREPVDALDCLLGPAKDSADWAAFKADVAVLREVRVRAI